MLAIDSRLDMSILPSTCGAEIDQHNQFLQWPVFTRAWLAGFARAMTRDKHQMEDETCVVRFAVLCVN